MEEFSMEKETVKKCPILYRMRNRPCTETCMCWGWEIDKGWEKIVRDASIALEKINNEIYPIHRIRIQANQIKQKYGTLCFYLSVEFDTDDIEPPDNLAKLIDETYKRADAIVGNAEWKCEHTCEKCGRELESEDSPVCITQGWITVLCKDCAEKSGSNYRMNGKLMNGSKEISE